MNSTRQINTSDSARLFQRSRRLLCRVIAPTCTICVSLVIFFQPVKAGGTEDSRAVGTKNISANAEAHSRPRIPPRPQPFKTTPLTMQEQTPPKPRLSTLPSLLNLEQSPRSSHFPNSPNSSNQNSFDIDDAPWVLTPDQKIWPLRYQQPSLPTHLVISVPTANELKLFLPGQVSDFIDRTRFAIERYVNDSLGAATQIRRRQLEQVQSWLETVLGQQQTLPNADWPQYQFSKDARATAADYRTQIEAQSPPAIEHFVEEANRLVSGLTALMPAMPTHAMSKATYDLMVRTQEGLELFQAQLAKDDSHILQALEEGLRRIPAHPRPDEPHPAEEFAPKGGGWRPTASRNAASMPERSESVVSNFEISVTDTRPRHASTPQHNPNPRSYQPEQRSQVYLPQQESTGSSLLGYLVLAVAGFGLFSLLVRRRKQKSH